MSDKGTRLTLDLQKSITRDEAKKVHGKLPEGGVWRTVRGHHIYIVGGKIVAGAFKGANGKAAKSTKAHIDELQKHISKKGITVGPSGGEDTYHIPPQAFDKPGKKGTAKAPAKAPAKAKKEKPETVKQVLGYKPGDGVKKRVKAAEKKKVVENRAIRAAKKERDAKAAPILKVDVPKDKVKKVMSTPKKESAPKGTQDKALKKWSELEQDTEKTIPIDTMWASEPVQKLLKLKPEKRTEEQIRAIAGSLSEAHDKLARHVVLRLGEKRGMELARQVNKIKQTEVGEVLQYTTHEVATDAEGEVELNEDGSPKIIAKKHKHSIIYDTPIIQETNQYGDLLQTARLAMYETFHNVLSGSQNPAEGASIGAHVVNRMKQAVDREMQDLLNQMPVPEEMRPAIGAMRAAETKLANKLGRMPTDAELGEHLSTVDAFKKAPINAAPKWDEKKGQWVATRNDELSSEDRVKMLKIYAARQKASSLHANIGDEGEKKVERVDKLTDEGDRPEDVVNKVDRADNNKKLSEAIPRALKEIGLSDEERKVFIAMFSEASTARNQGHLTQGEVAERVGMKQQDVSRILATAMKKLSEARSNKHPIFDELSMYKSLMKALYEFDLVKSLLSWGIHPDALVERFVRIDYADGIDDLQKSLLVTEYVGSYVTTDDGKVHARIVELTLPEDNAIYKAFNDELQKSMFPHKGKTNYEVNQKASEYAKSNPKLKGLSERQHAAVRGKGGTLTWSEQLLVKYPGSAWITWGGKKILIHTGSGEILYDSRNELHREQHNQGAPEEKIDFHHEKEALDEYHGEREKALRKQWEEHIRGKEQQAVKTGKAFDYQAERDSFAKKNQGASFEGTEMKYAPDESADYSHVIDHGVKAFKDEMEKMRSDWHGENGIRKQYLSESSHKAHDVYGELSEDERKEFDAMDEAGRKKFLGERYINAEGVKEAMADYHKYANAGKDKAAEEAKGRAIEAMKAAGSVAARNAGKMEEMFKEVKKTHPNKGDNWASLTETLGAKEMTRAKEEASKKFIPEGKYVIGNPITGKTMVVNIGGSFEGGRAGKGGKYTQAVAEAFDPEGGSHEIVNSWGQLGKALGYSGDDAKKLQEILVKKGNTDPDKPFMQKISEADYAKHRSKTKLGLQETSLHKDFKMVYEHRDNDGNVQSRTYSMKMPDGSENSIEVGGDGYLQDPVMARLVKQRKAIENEADLHEVLKEAIGNRAWVTAHFGGDIHIGDALGHHVQLEYDGRGAPRVIGGKYDGYRFVDSRDLPKGATDPATGEPVKALFNDGKLVDRKLTTKHDVAIAEGNEVLIPNGKGGWRKGKVSGKTDSGDWVVRDMEGIQRVYKENELGQTKKEGYTKAESGQAAVRLAQHGTHRLDESQLESDDHRKALARAMAKAKVKVGPDGQHEWSDSALRRLQGRLAKEGQHGQDILKKVNSAYTKELEVHVPEGMRTQLEHEGVRVHTDGKARISVGKFEQLRESLGGMSLDHGATEYLAEHFKRKDRVPMSVDELTPRYHPGHADPKDDFGKHFRSQFKEDSMLLDKEKGLYGTQLEGIHHLRTRGRAIAGHGMGTGKTITGVVTALHHKAEQLAAGKKAGKTLVVSPAGIRSDWGKEIGSHTKSKALYIGTSQDRQTAKKGEDGKHYWGQEGTEQEHVLANSFFKNQKQHASEDHDFHIVSYDQFMKHRDKFANSGMYDNIVIDEIHGFKNKAGKRGKALSETTDKFKNVWGFSGTPMENDAREMHSLIDSVTGGRHELGSSKEFTDNYLMKDKNGKITGIKPDKAEKLGDILANLVQFRGSEDVTYGGGEKISFPGMVSHDGDTKHDFIGGMIDRSRDHATTEHYGTKHSVVDYTTGTKTAKSKAGEDYDVTVHSPDYNSASMTPQWKDFYDNYSKLQNEVLPESKLQELATASATGQAKDGVGQKENYLTASMTLQKYINAPLAANAYFPGAKSALHSDATNAQAETATAEADTPEGASEGGKHFTVDEHGHKRYFRSDGKGGYLKNEKGDPLLIDPLHHNNPKAQYLKQRLTKYLDLLASENAARRKAGKTEMMPKVAVKSSYTTFGTDVIENVFRDLEREHPELKRWKAKTGDKFGYGRFTGEAEDREATKTAYRGDKNDYANNQGHMWGIAVSPAGKEGIDLGNSHMMMHYDQEYNPEKMAQFTARVRRSDSFSKAHQAVGRANAVRVESLHVPGTVEDFVFNTQDKKAENTKKVKAETRQAEQSPRYGDTADELRRSSIAKKKRKATAKGAIPLVVSQPKKPDLGGGAAAIPKPAAAAVAKSLKLVILI